MTEPYYADEHVTVHAGDCLDVLKTLADSSVDAVVTDPPYGLEFMGKDWDRFGRGDANSQAVAGMTATVYADGAKRLDSPSYLGGMNPKCRNCGRWSRGYNPCTCKAPDFPNERRARATAFQQWCEQWATECLRVLKPGGHMLAFGGTRTWHRLAAAIEDAGFEIRDSIAWLYGSGFPKSLDVSKAIDKAAGAEREVVGERKLTGTARRTVDGGSHGAARTNSAEPRERVETFEQITAPATDAAKQWQGWGTALKPAFEPIVVARKPLRGTVANNVQTWGTGALNVDACRVATTDKLGGGSAQGFSVDTRHDGWARPWMTDPEGIAAQRARSDENIAHAEAAGRWPANVVLDGDTADELDRQSGNLPSQRTRTDPTKGTSATGSHLGTFNATRSNEYLGEQGGASRFFPTFKYTAKAPGTERPTADGIAHPTVKPLELMRWLVRLVTPPNGVVLDPFAGSGTTAEAAIHEHKRAVLIEKEADYLPLIVSRLSKPMAIGFDFDEEVGA